MFACIFTFKFYNQFHFYFFLKNIIGLYIQAIHSNIIKVISDKKKLPSTIKALPTQMDGADYMQLNPSV